MTSTSRRRPLPWGRIAVLSVILMEIVVALEISELIGVGWTLLSLAGLSAFGCSVIGREGRKAWTTFTASAADGSKFGPAGFWSTTAGRAAGRSPDTAVGLTAGVLLTVPGFCTAMWGGLLLIPAVRQYAGRWLEGRLARRVPPASSVRIPGPAGPESGATSPSDPRAAAPPSGKVVVGEIIVTDLTDHRDTPVDSEEPGPRRAPGSST